MRYLGVISNTDDIVTKTYADASASYISINTQSGTTYTSVIGDAGKLINFTNASAVTFTVPTDASVAYDIGSIITILQSGAGQVTVTPAGGVTVNSANGLKLASQYSTAELIKISSNTWLLAGRTII